MGVLLDGTIQTFGSIMCLARRTGSFTQGSSWLGLTAPTVDFCASVGGCDLYIPSGVTLDTESLNGVLNIQFNLITVTSGGIFQLGTTGVAGGFSFFYQFIFIVYGQLGYVSSDNTGIRIPFGTDFNLFSGASISASASVSLSIYNTATNTTVGSALTLQTGTSSGVFVAVSSSGDVEQNTGGTFIAARSGSFNVSNTWVGGVLPSGNCFIRIPAKLKVTFIGAVLNLNLQMLTIDGTFTVVSTGSVGFAFGFGINIIINAGGTFRDQTDNHRIYCKSDTLFTFLSGSSFAGSNTQICSYNGSSPSTCSGSSFSLGSNISSPFTLGILLDGSIQTFSSVMYIVRQSGSFSNSNTWLGLVTPKASFCSSIGGCDLYIPSGVNLNTNSLNGVLNIRFNVITIPVGAILQLGTAGVSGGFRFIFGVSLEIHGQLVYSATESNSFYFPFGSNFNFYENATFATTVTASLRIYNSATNRTIGSGIILDNDFTGPIFVEVTSSGTVSIDSGGK